MPRTRRTPRTRQVPPKVVEAFAPPILHVGTVELLPMTMGHVLALERAGNTILESFRRASIAEGLEAVYLCTLSGSEAIRAARDKATLRRAVEAFAVRVPAREKNELVKKLARYWVDAFAVLVPDAEAGADGPFQTSPPAETPSAGGSPSTTGSAPTTG